MIVKCNTIRGTEIARLADTHHNGFGPAVEAPQHLGRRNFPPVPSANSFLDRLKQTVLAYALLSAEDERMVDLLAGPLHPMSKPTGNVSPFVRKHSLNVLKPRSGPTGGTCAVTAASSP